MKKTTSKKSSKKTFSVTELVRVTDLSQVVGGWSYDPIKKKEIVGGTLG